MLREPLGIQFVEILRFLAGRVLEKLCRFHRQWLEGTARQGDTGDAP
jgi:hypothetical protein